MGFMDSFLNAMKLNPDEDDYDEDDYEEEEPVVEFQSKEKKKYVEPSEEDYEAPKKAAANRSSIRKQPQPVRRASSNAMEVVVLKPTEFENASEITDTLLSNRTVVLNLESANYDKAQRIIDFAYGTIYAIKGNMQQISQFIFILTPASGMISGEESDGSNNSFGLPFHN